ncbi:alpha/beta hydrolase [Piscinibacter sp. XHJ-5]|uniref:alpha/beta fold hydrolase n=1 Tax=Piscinibacter sp. XHJ-5 TaxID=3037797 RepID=UPI002452C1E1|nr:alpha/beta hydrolase [Piscinibacter sp. XHJ-5]
MRTPSLRRPSDPRWLVAAAGTAAVLAACAIAVQRQTQRAERDFPPKGRFVSVDGVRLHFTVHGRDDAAQTVVLLHGNGTMAEEFELSGLTRQLAERYRVVVFDRPGFGWSERPDGHRWGPSAQADLLHAALARLGVSQPVVLGHSWGALVALAMGLRHPKDLGSLVLVSGYYFPTVRVDTLMLSAPALPVIGSLWRHTVGPLLGRLLWPLAVRRAFAPASPTAAFRDGYPAAMSLRPSQLRASAAESAMMIPATASLQRRYAGLEVPAVLVAGADDQVMSTRWHSGRLHHRLDRSWLRIVEGSGHMVHHVATGQTAAAVDQAAALVWDRSLLLRPPAGLRGDDARRGAAPQVVPLVPCATRP